MRLERAMVSGVALLLAAAGCGTHDGGPVKGVMQGGQAGSGSGGIGVGAAGGGSGVTGVGAAGGGNLTGQSGSGASGGGTSPGGAIGGDNASGGSTSPGGAISAGSGGEAPGGWRLPEANAGFDYQIGGVYAPPADVKVVSRDRQSPTAPNLYNICYVNGFQAQAGEKDFWLNDHPELVLRDAAAMPIIDPNWDEMLLDTSTSAKRTALSAIVGGWIEGCKADGFDAVEIDNLDSYSRSQGLLTQDDNVAFVQLLAERAHALDLAIAQKNSTELLERAQQMQTDFAVVEECNRWDECADYRAVYGDLVFVIEYRRQDFDKGCKAFPGLSIVLRDLDVSTPASASYVYDGC